MSEFILYSTSQNLWENISAIYKNIISSQKTIELIELIELIGKYDIN